MRRKGRPDVVLVKSESEGSIDNETHRSPLPLLISYPSNKVNPYMEQTEMQFHKRRT